MNKTTNPGIKDSTIGVITKVDKIKKPEDQAALEDFLINSGTAFFEHKMDKYHNPQIISIGFLS